MEPPFFIASGSVVRVLLASTNCLHWPFDDERKNDSSDSHHCQGEVDLIVTTGDVAGGLGGNHDPGKIFGYGKSADTPGCEHDAVVGAGVLGAEVVSGEGRHQGQVAAVGESNDTQADERTCQKFWAFLRKNRQTITYTPSCVVPGVRDRIVRVVLFPLVP
jgi:hypothetical protein